MGKEICCRLSSSLMFTLNNVVRVWMLRIDFDDLFIISKTFNGFYFYTKPTYGIKLTDDVLLIFTRSVCALRSSQKKSSFCSSNPTLYLLTLRFVSACTSREQRETTVPYHLCRARQPLVITLAFSVRSLDV